MQEQPLLSDTQDESYFASFTDMLVGIILIFIILLMMVASNYQEAAEELNQTSQALQEARNKARDEARDRARDEARDKARDEARDRARDAVYAREIASIKELAEAKTIEAARALEGMKALESEKALREANTRQAASPVQDTRKTGETNVASIANVNEETRLINTQQNMFNDSRAKVLQKIQTSMNMQGFDVTADIHQGALLIPENILFDPNRNTEAVNYRGKQTLSALGTLLSKYLPCISPTADAARLNECNALGFAPNDGLDAIFIDDYPDSDASREEKLLLAVQRVISVFNELKNNNLYLDKELKNISGMPILDIKVNQERRKAGNWEENYPAVRKFVVLRFIIRNPRQEDILKLRNSAGTP